MRILLVCTGNTCRSPMAEALLMQLAKNKGVDLECDSAGIYGLEGAPMTTHAKRVLEEDFGISVFNHRAAPLTARQIHWADRIIPMTDDHKLLIEQKFSAGDKILSLPKSIPDPYGGYREDYRRCAERILEGLSDLWEQGAFHE